MPGLTGDQRVLRGAFGERLAGLRLEAAGYTLLDRNWHCRGGEIDLVAARYDAVVFVEVRTRRCARPELSIGARKRQRLRVAAYQWLLSHDRLAAEWRIDVMLIELDARGVVRRIEQIEAAVGEA